MKENAVKTSNINLRIHLDNEHIPVAMDWDATDSAGGGRKEARSAMVAIWDHIEKESLRIDLWTKDMTVEEMNHFFYQSLISMSDTFKRATGNEEVSNSMKEFARTFGKKLNIVERPKK